MREKAAVILSILVILVISFSSYSICAQEPESSPSDGQTAAVSAASVQALAEPPTFVSEPTVVLTVTVGSPGNAGAASASIPIEVPPGRNGIAPKLALIYSSNMPNGIAGVGWSIGLGEIQRSTKKGLNYNGTDFVFVMNGSSSELVLRPDGYYGEKIERTFSRYYLDPSSGGWIVTTKDGTKYHYGTTTDSIQDNSQGVFKWCLKKVLDTNGNYMTVTYRNRHQNDLGGGDIYIDRIDYTANEKDGSLATNYVQFFYEQRSDAPPIYTTNAGVATTHRLKNIETYANNQAASIKT